MTRPTQTDTALVAYLALLASREPAGGLLEIRYRQPDSPGRMRQHWHPAERPAGAAREILELAERTDVYVGVAPRRHRHGGRSAIERSWMLWADLDQTDTDAHMANLAVAPGVVVGSGTQGHHHLYWPLAQPLTGPEVERANRVLARALHADTGAVLNAATILRPPGTRNHKHAPAAAVTLERLESRAHTAAQILQGLPTDPDTPTRAAAPRISTPDALLAIEPARYVQAITGLRVPCSRKVSCPFHQDRTPSLHVYPQAAQGWACFGCGRGGSIYDLAGELWQLHTRGPEFVELRNRLRDLLLPNTTTPRHEGATTGRG
jgi:hypothetical protein